MKSYGCVTMSRSVGSKVKGETGCFDASVTRTDMQMSPHIDAEGQEESNRTLAESWDVPPQCDPATLEQTLNQTVLQVSRD